MKHHVMGALSVLTAVAATGCAPSAARGPETPQRIEVRIVNNLTPSTPVNIVVAGEPTARRRQAGFVVGNETKVVSFPATGLPTKYILIAQPQSEPPGGTAFTNGSTGFEVRGRSVSEIYSQPIELIPGRDFTWDLTANMVMADDLYRDDSSSE